MRQAQTTPHPALRTPHRQAAFTLIEVMVVVVLMSVVILGLTAMFSQTQRAFKAGMTQTDLLEGGRMVTEMLSRELEQVVPAYSTLDLGRTNFYVYNLYEFSMTLPANSSLRTNFMSDILFLTHENQTWTGIGYFVVPETTGTALDPVPLGTLYRFETNLPAAQFAQNPGAFWNGFKLTRSGFNVPTVSKIIDGVVSFNFRCYDTNGYWINPYLSGKVWQNSSNSFLTPQINYHFVSNALPAYVEFELGIVEQGVLDHYRSIPLYDSQTNYITKQAGRVQLFRQRVSVRNVDRSAY